MRHGNINVFGGGYLLKKFNELKEKLKLLTLIIAVLMFCALVLSVFFFPHSVDGVALLCGMGFCFSFGTVIGVMLCINLLETEGG